MINLNLINKSPVNPFSKQEQTQQFYNHSDIHTLSYLAGDVSVLALTGGITASVSFCSISLRNFSFSLSVVIASNWSIVASTAP